LERAPGISVDEIIEATEGTLILEGEIPEIILIKEIENSWFRYYSMKKPVPNIWNGFFYNLKIITGI